MEKKVVRSTIYNGACLPGLSLFRVSHTRLRWPLSLSPLVTDPAASRPPAEREDVHRFSVRRRRGSTSRSAVHAVLSDQAPARQGLRHLLADSARCRSPSYIPTTSRYPLRPCSTARLPTSLHVDLPQFFAQNVAHPAYFPYCILVLTPFQTNTTVLLSSLRTRNMLLFCRRMCHQLLLASNCFLSTSFLQTGLSISPRCYCDLLVNCTNHFFLKSVLCSCTKMSHGQRLYISVRLHKGRLVLLYPPHPTPSLIFSNQLVLRETAKVTGFYLCVYCFISSPLLS